jgi:hypothetical protein
MTTIFTTPHHFKWDITARILFKLPAKPAIQHVKADDNHHHQDNYVNVKGCSNRSV